MATMQDFTILNKLGSGAFSEVYKVIRKDDRKHYALKKVRLAKLTAKEKDNAINEVRILASIQHQNICGYKEAFFEQGSSSLCIVMELANGGDLQTKINSAKRTMRHLKEEEIWSIFYQMVNGLNALHTKKIVHRDIKCANVFLTKEGIVKLGDLNVSKIAKAGVMQTQTGTPYYASPEVWQDKPYDKSSDIWSLGAVLYEMVALNPPFQARDMKGLYNKVVKGVYPKIPATFSSDLASMIASLLKVDPKKRPSTEQILHMPVFIAKYNEHQRGLGNNGILGEESKELIGTIKVPKNLSLLTNVLPASQYEAPEGYDQHVQAAAALPQIAESQEDEYVPMVKATPVKSTHLPVHSPSGGSRAARILSSNKKKAAVVQNNARLMSGAQRNAGAGQERKQSVAQHHQQQQYISSTTDDPAIVNSADRMRPNNKRSHQSELINVQPYSKKYLQGVPGSSPVIRAVDDLKYEQKYGKGPLIERAERLKRLQELKENMNLRANERKESEDGAIRMIKDTRMKRIGVDNSNRRMPSSNLDVIHKGANVQILYSDEPGNVGGVPPSELESNLPSIHGGGSQLNNNHYSGGRPSLGNHGYAPYQPTPQYNYMNNIPQKRGGSRFVKPPLHQIYGPNSRNDTNSISRQQSALQNGLARARSKDYIHSVDLPPSAAMHANRYGGGASGIIEAGRQESQRMIMERYRRIDVNEQQPQADPRRYRSKVLASAQPQSPYQQSIGGSVPPGGDSVRHNHHHQRNQPIDSSRQYIPMSQKGTRPIQYSGARGDSRQLHPAMAMKLMYNQPSQAQQFPGGGGVGASNANYHVHGVGGQSTRPSWWG